jgi:uncharacterized protein (DUF433 family)
MTLSIPTEPIPLECDVDGAVRVRGSRVTLDTIVAAFSEGATAEEIAQQYPSLDLGDVYAVIAFYLRHRAEVVSYLEERRVLGEAARRQNESRCDPTGVRDRLMARRRTRE